MPSFCNCDTCKKIKNQMKFPKCKYCEEHHDTRVACPSYVEYMRDIDKMNKSHFKEMEIPVVEPVKCPDCQKHHDKGKVECDSPNGYKDKLRKESEYFIDVANGKYSVYMKKQGSLFALRYGEPWQDLCGNNLVFNLMVELIEAKEKISRCLDQYENYWAGDGDNVACTIKSILEEGEK